MTTVFAFRPSQDPDLGRLAQLAEDHDGVVVPVRADESNAEGCGQLYYMRFETSIPDRLAATIDRLASLYGFEPVPRGQVLACAGSK